MKERQERLRKLYKKLNRGFHRYVNGTKGAISLFLAILMVPFATIAGSLVNAARINSAVAVFDEALCNASNSTLGTYDEFLRMRFGMLAMCQNTASYGSGYTVQDLISETFVFYMEQNLGALSNTYTSFDVSATGVYPLADTDVLLSQVMEASKYTVPAKLVIDGLSLDDLLTSLTDSLSLASSIFGTLSAGASMADKFLVCEEALNALSTQITASETARTEYDTAYNSFIAAVNAYNALIDEIKQELADKQTAVDNAETKVNQCQETLDTEAEKISDLLQEIENMENEKDANGNKVDNTEKIAEFKETHKDEMAAYNTAFENLNTAKSELSSAETALNNVISSYANSLSEKRTAVTNAKSTYVTKIGNFALELQATGEAVIAAQSSIYSVINSGVSLVENLRSTIYEGQKQGINNQIKDMEKSRDAAKKRGDNTAKYLWQDEIDAAKEKQTKIKNENVLDTAYKTEPVKIAVSEMNRFTTEPYQSAYSEAYGRLITLKSNVQSYVVCTDSTTKLEGATSYYETISQILSAGDVNKLQENLGQEVAKSSFIALVKAVVGFVKAIFNLTTWYDLELCANIDTNNYSSIGGLPSMKDRSDGSKYSLKSEFADVDQQKSDYYKELLGEYSNNPAVAGNATTISDVIDNIKNSINTISKLNWDNFIKVLFNLKTIVTEIGNIVTSVISFIANLVKIVTDAIKQKILLSGYIAYNIPNRTTYTGDALTGAGYSLPNKYSEQQGYAFYGAETEYIIHGSLSETDNQSSLFNTIYLLRLVLNIAGVATNGEVATLAGQAGAATFGIGTVVVYILYFIAEPFVDTLILVNSGSIPIIKTKVYLTPSGIPDLLSAFLKLSLTEAQKNSAYQKVIKVASVGQASDRFAENYADAISSGIKDPELETGNKFTESWNFDYTKTLILIMTLFTSTDKMVSRLADIVQMEGSYDAVNRIDRYTFNLDQSYTYLRAAGTFEANEFIKISDGIGLNSKERVVYRGY